MNRLSVITQVVEQDFGDQFPQSVQTLLSFLSAMKSKTQTPPHLIFRLQQAQSRIQSLNKLLQTKTAQALILQRKNSQLLCQLQQKEKQLASLVQVNSEFKKLVQQQTKAIQSIDQTNNLQEVLVQQRIECVKYKELVHQILENKEPQVTNLPMRKSPPRQKKVGYFPSNRRKFKNGILI